jgi:phage recombination protein Bet
MTKELELYQKLEMATGFKSEEIAIISNTIAKGTTPTELAYFLNVAKSSGLNPFMKQIWCYKDHKCNIIIMAGRDGFLSIAQKDSRWNGMVSSEVYKEDLFNVDVINGIIEHKPNFTERETLIGAYCYIKPKGVDLGTFEYVNLKDYDKGQFIWNSHKNEMIKKVAEVHALKKAFGISGLYCEEEMINEPDAQITDEDIIQMISEAETVEALETIKKIHKNVRLKIDIFNLWNKRKSELE